MIPQRDPKRLNRLKPCLFCGWPRVTPLRVHGGFQAQCNRCKAWGPLAKAYNHITKDTWIMLWNKAIKLWNKRDSMSTEEEKSIKDFLEFTKGMSHASAFLLKHGRPFAIGPQTFLGKRDKAKQCYRNAALRALDGEGTYIEGYVGWMIPLEHAWLMAPDGTVIDPTLNGKGREHEMFYFGVAFSNEYLSARLLKRKVFGLLSPIDPKLVDGSIDFAPKEVAGKSK
jgi:hypothetical protein